MSITDADHPVYGRSPAQDYLNLCRLLEQQRFDDFLNYRTIAEMIVPAHMLRPAWENRILRRQYEK